MLTRDENPYAPTDIPTNESESTPRSPRNTFLMLLARFCLVVSAVAVSRTHPKLTDFYQILVYAVSLLALITFATIVFKQMNRSQNDMPDAH